MRKKTFVFAMAAAVALMTAGCQSKYEKVEVPGNAAEAPESAGENRKRTGKTSRRAERARQKAKTSRQMEQSMRRLHRTVDPKAKNSRQRSA